MQKYEKERELVAWRESSITTDDQVVGGGNNNTCETCRENNATRTPCRDNAMDGEIHLLITTVILFLPDQRPGIGFNVL